MWGINNPKIITSTICANILRKEKLNNFADLKSGCVVGQKHNIFSKCSLPVRQLTLPSGGGVPFQRSVLCLRGSFEVGVERLKILQIKQIDFF